MDLGMREMEGVAATHRIHTELPNTQVLVLTTYADDKSLFPRPTSWSSWPTHEGRRRRGGRTRYSAHSQYHSSP